MPDSTPPELLRFGTVGSPSTTPQPGTPAAVGYSRLLGLDHLEIAWVQSVRVSDDTCAAIRAAAQEHRVTLSIHAPYYINLNSQTPELDAQERRTVAGCRPQGAFWPARATLSFTLAPITTSLLNRSTSASPKSCGNCGPSSTQKA
ncbi:MAG: hypothetical protein KatS3mg051_0275 [Anaerolineae bacterium]|nr:MAG: hypothetical protein KatS3mg051_0275 [Anaerolineae bacterium]